MAVIWCNIEPLNKDKVGGVILTRKAGGVVRKIEIVSLLLEA